MTLRLWLVIFHLVIIGEKTKTKTKSNKICSFNSLNDVVFYLKTKKKEKKKKKKKKKEWKNKGGNILEKIDTDCELVFSCVLHVTNGLHWKKNINMNNSADWLPYQ